MIDRIDIVFVLISAIALIGVAAVVITLVLRRHRAQRPYSVAISDIDMRRTWTLWIEGEDIPEREKLLRNQLLEQLDDEAIDAVREDLIQLDHDVHQGKYPLTAIRKELMASVDRRMLNTEILRLPDDVRADLRRSSSDVIQDDAQARRYLAANELRLQVLREYAARRYGDKAPHDWFTVYERASRLKQRNARAWIEHTISGDHAPGENERQQAMSIVDTQLKMRLLQVPPGTEFPDLQKAPEQRTLH